MKIDIFPNCGAQIQISGPFGFETVGLACTSPAEIHADLSVVQDPDGDGKDEVNTRIVQMELNGTSALLGPITLRLRDAGRPPFTASEGTIEETINNTPGLLDLPPFVAIGTADGFFDVFFEIEAPSINSGPMLLHNINAKRLQAVVCWRGCRRASF